MDIFYCLIKKEGSTKNLITEASELARAKGNSLEKITLVEQCQRIFAKSLFKPRNREKTGFYWTRLSPNSKCLNFDCRGNCHKKENKDD